MLRVLITIYRANPLRPHCNAAAGIHSALCRIIPGATAICDENSGYHPNR